MNPNQRNFEPQQNNINNNNYNPYNDNFNNEINNNKNQNTINYYNQNGNLESIGANLLVTSADHIMLGNRATNKNDYYKLNNAEKWKLDKYNVGNDFSRKRTNNYNNKIFKFFKLF